MDAPDGGARGFLLLAQSKRRPSRAHDAAPVDVPLLLPPHPGRLQPQLARHARAARDEPLRERLEPRVSRERRRIAPGDHRRVFDVALRQRADARGAARLR